jgi:NAD(P)-dependent dehydrogenase (short-subunit alcohol dehydrogenase family)
MTAVRLDGKVALVTGASRGIGHAIALELARHGGHVIALARSAELLADLANNIGAACSPLVCDLTSQDDIERVSKLVQQRWGRLDVLIGNAAIMGPRIPLSELRESDWRTVFDTNVSSNWRLIHNFDHLLRASEAGRAIFVTSGAGSRAQMAPARGAYAISKAALDALARTYASETASSNVRVMLCNPGPLRTGLRASAAPDEDPMTLRMPSDFASKVVALCLPSWKETGRMYDFPQDRLLDFTGPA